MALGLTSILSSLSSAGGRNMTSDGKPAKPARPERPKAIQILPMRQFDLSAILLIEAGAYGQDAWDESEFWGRWCSRKHWVFVALIDERCVGYLCLERGSKSECPNTIWIENLAVDPDFRRWGFGSLMLSFAKEFARDRQRSMLRAWVYESHLAALNFLKAGGFIATKIIPAA